MTSWLNPHQFCIYLQSFNILFPKMKFLWIISNKFFLIQKHKLAFFWDFLLQGSVLRLYSYSQQLQSVNFGSYYVHLQGLHIFSSSFTLQFLYHDIELWYLSNLNMGLIVVWASGVCNKTYIRSNQSTCSFFGMFSLRI